MIQAWLGPDPEAGSLRTGIVNEDVMDALAYALAAEAFTSAEVHREAGLEDIIHGNERVIGHFGSSSPKYYTRYDDPDWAVVFNTDCQGDKQRGWTILEPLLREAKGAEK